MNYSRPRLG